MVGGEARRGSGGGTRHSEASEAAGTRHVAPPQRQPTGRGRRAGCAQRAATRPACPPASCGEGGREREGQPQTTWWAAAARGSAGGCSPKQRTQHLKTDAIITSHPTHRGITASSSSMICALCSTPLVAWCCCVFSSADAMRPINMLTMTWVPRGLWSEEGGDAEEGQARAQVGRSSEGGPDVCCAKNEWCIRAAPARRTHHAHDKTIGHVQQRGGHRVVALPHHAQVHHALLIGVHGEEGCGGEGGGQRGCRSAQHLGRRSVHAPAAGPPFSASSLSPGPHRW